MIMKYALVRFTDGIYHIARSDEIKNMKKGIHEASVFWKKHRCFYLATILKECCNKANLVKLKKDYESGEMRNEEILQIQERTLIVDLSGSSLDCESANHCESVKDFTLDDRYVDEFGDISSSMESQVPEMASQRQTVDDEAYDAIKSQSKEYAVLKTIEQQTVDDLTLDDRINITEFTEFGDMENHAPEMASRRQTVDDETYDAIKSQSKEYAVLKTIEQQTVDDLTLDDRINITEFTEFGDMENHAPEMASRRQTVDDEAYDAIKSQNEDYAVPKTIEHSSIDAENTANQMQTVDAPKVSGRNINILSLHVIPAPTEAIDKNKSKEKYPSKDQYCIFCKSKVKRFGRHIAGKHKGEEEVKEIFNYEKKSIERKRIIDKLRSKGNYEFNHKEHSTKIVARRSINKASPREYTDCPSCLVRVSKVSLRRHYRKCNANTQDNTRDTYVKSKRVTLSLHPLAHSILKDHIFPVFRNDANIRVIRNDYLAILYGNKLVAKYRSPHHYKMIRANMRYIGRFLLEMKRRSNKIADFASCFIPCHYDDVVESIKVVAGFDDRIGAFNAPNTASTLGTLLKFCAAILESDYIKKQNEHKRREVENFLKLLRTEFPTDINKTATENQATIRRRKKIILPSSSDIKKFIEYLRAMRTSLSNEIMQEFSYTAWKSLAGYTLVGIMVYNGRRPGEIERLTISDYKESSLSVSQNPELLESRPSHQNSDSSYTRCVLRGKLCRNVTIVLHEDEVKCINLILNNRIIAGVDDENTFVFGLPGPRPHKFLSASLLLKKFAAEANLNNPERFFATNIRKNLATKSSKLDLQPEDREHIMNFMGHSEKIHKGIYRQPDYDKDIFIMPKVLDFVSGNTGNNGSSSEKNPRTIPPNNSDITYSSSLSGSHVESDFDKPNSPCNSKSHVESNFDKPNSTCHSKSHVRRSPLSVMQEKSWDSPDTGSEYNPNDDTSDSSNAVEEVEDRKGKIIGKGKRKKLIDMYLGYVPRKSWTTEERHAARKYFQSEFSKCMSPTSSRCFSAVKDVEELKNRTPRQLKAWIHNEINKSKKKAQTANMKGRRSWSTPEKTICRVEFGREVKNGEYPDRQKIKRVLNKYEELRGRTPAMLMSHLQHAIKKSRESKE
ncbi:unnamed protein product [Phaedon cochleariae]|uniref:Uncharacterized protein n=1 Tax=Phaedon cochleariae TaxID=80249 RepID=A0A9P0GWS1_PHACE|nr:unnamed protein product [Phaedon cochleariae]